MKVKLKKEKIKMFKKLYEWLDNLLTRICEEITRR